MKTKNLLFSAALLLAACGTSTDAGWKTDDLRYVPLIGTFWDEGSEQEYIAYVDTREGKEVGTFGSGTLFYDGCALVDRTEGLFFVDGKMNPLTAKTYYDATVFHDGIAWAVERGGPLTAIDKKGRSLFELKQAETACAFHEGVAVFADANGMWGLVDKKGNVIVEPQWDDVVPMVVNGLIAVKAAEGWGLANRKGEMMADCLYKEVGTKNYEEGFLWNYVQALQQERIPVKDAGGKWGVIDRKGRYLINPQFDELFLDGKNYLFRKGRVYGWCDKEGQYLINPQFGEAHRFGESDLAAVKDRNGDWGYIDREGKWIINAQFREAGPFLPSGIAPARDESSREWGTVDKTGKWVVNPQFRSMYDYGATDKLLVKDLSQKFGIIASDGKYVVSPQYANARAELLSNVSGVGARYKAQSDYVDVEAYAALIDEQIRTFKSSTTGELLAAYGIKESRFSKSGGETTLSRKNATRDMTFQIKVSGVNAWNKASDGWFGYNYTFRPNISVDSYMLGVEFDNKGKAWRFVPEIFDVLKKRYPYDEENGTFTVPGCSLVFGAAIPNGGMVFQVKTNKE